MSAALALSPTSSRKPPALSIDPPTLATMPMRRRDAMQIALGAGVAAAARSARAAGASDASPDAPASGSEKDDAAERMRKKIEASKKNYRPASSLIEERRSRGAADADEASTGRQSNSQSTQASGVIEDL